MFIGMVAIKVKNGVGKMGAVMMPDYFPGLSHFVYSNGLAIRHSLNEILYSACIKPKAVQSAEQ